MSTTTNSPYSTFRASHYMRDTSTLVTQVKTEDNERAMLLTATSSHDIIITKAQAMEFFGLVDPNNEDETNRFNQMYFSHR